MKTRDKILEKINENPGVTLIGLSKAFFKSKGNISIHLKKLEKEKLIKKHLQEENKKIFRLHPTKQGKEVYLKLKLEVVYRNHGNS